jgi:hypothetical protein
MDRRYNEAVESVSGPGAVPSQIRQYLAGSNGSLGRDIGEKGEQVPKNGLLRQS